MSETSYYNLHLTPLNTDETFVGWRTNMNGDTDSNMIKIDNALHAKAEHSVSISAVLSAQSWSGDSSPFSQTIVVSGLLASSNGYISVAQSATFDQRKSARNAVLAVSLQEDGELTVVADGKKPDIDIPVCIVITD